MSLRGKVVAITRPRGQAEELAEIVAERGGIPYIAPTIEIGPVGDPSVIKEFADRIVAGWVDYVVFMSRNAVTYLLKALDELGLTGEVAKAFGRVKVVAVGPRTRKELEDRGLRVHFTPSDYSSEGVVRLLQERGIRGKSIVLLRARSASRHLKRELEKGLAQVLEVPTYESSEPTDKTGVVKLMDDLLGGGIDLIVFTSSATAQNLFRIAGERRLSDKLGAWLRDRVVVAAIGPATQRTLEELGVRAHVVPREYTVSAMVAAIEDYLKCRCSEHVSPNGSPEQR